MTSTSTRSNLSAVALQQVVLPAPWEAFLLPISTFPIPEAELVLLQRLLAKFTAVACDLWNLSREVFIQLEQFQNQQARDIYLRRAPAWIPEVGLGVWPDRKPPASWTREEFEEAGLQGTKLRPLMYQVFHITGSERAKAQAHEEMLPFGPLLEFLSPGGAQPVFDRGEAALVPGIQDSSYSCFPFYVPLIELKTATGARPDLLAGWLGDSIYVRESFEDSGILFVSSRPLSRVFHEIAGEPGPGGERSWRVPV